MTMVPHQRERAEATAVRWGAVALLVLCQLLVMAVSSASQSVQPGTYTLVRFGEKPLPVEVDTDLFSGVCPSGSSPTAAVLASGTLEVDIGVSSTFQHDIYATCANSAGGLSDHHFRHEIRTNWREIPAGMRLIVFGGDDRRFFMGDRSPDFTYDAQKRAITFEPLGALWDTGGLSGGEPVSESTVGEVVGEYARPDLQSFLVAASDTVGLTVRLAQAAPDFHVCTEQEILAGLATLESYMPEDVISSRHPPGTVPWMWRGDFDGDSTDDFVAALCRSPVGTGVKHLVLHGNDTYVTLAEQDYVTYLIEVIPAGEPIEFFTLYYPGGPTPALYWHEYATGREEWLVWNPDMKHYEDALEQMDKTPRGISGSLSR